jgi:IS4 transposase
MHLSRVCDSWYDDGYVGKHKDHDVKTIRKAQPLVKAEVEKYVEKYENNIEKLTVKKSEIDKTIRGLS